MDMEQHKTAHSAIHMLLSTANASYHGSVLYICHKEKCVRSTNHRLLGNYRYTNINHYLKITLMTYCIKRFAARKLRHRHIINRSLYKYVLLLNTFLTFIWI